MGHLAEMLYGLPVLENSRNQESNEKLIYAINITLDGCVDPRRIKR